MTDQSIHETISELVAEEHRLRQAAPTDDSRERLAHLEQQLDQCWDLLRQRDALRDVGADPSTAHERPVGEVEGYLQ